jgi:hypothetical protein
MATVKKGTELWVTTTDQVGTAAGFTNAVSAVKANILAMSSYGQGNKGYFKMVTSDNPKAARAVKTLGYNVKAKDVLLVEVPNKPGTFQPLAQKIARAGININYSYWTALGAKSLVVLSTDNNARAMTALRG